MVERETSQNNKDQSNRVALPGGIILVFELDYSEGSRIPVNVLKALEVMKLTIPLTFPDKTTGVDQAGFRVEYEDDVRDLPKSSEAYYEEALNWAGPYLQGKGWSSKEVCDYLLEDNESWISNLGNVSKKTAQIFAEALRLKICEYFPGGQKAKRLIGKRKVLDW